MKFQFLPENFSRSENAPPFETRKIRQFEVERIFLENKKMVHHLFTPSVYFSSDKTLWNQMYMQCGCQFVIPVAPCDMGTVVGKTVKRSPR